MSVMLKTAEPAFRILSWFALVVGTTYTIEYSHLVLIQAACIFACLYVGYDYIGKRFRKK